MFVPWLIFASSIAITLLGGWDKGLEVLIICVCLDYVTGLVSAYKNSVLCPNVGFIGIVKKSAIIFLIMLSVQMDNFFGASRVHEMLVYFLTINEMLSIVTNLNNAGVPIPDFLTKALRGADDGK